MQFSAAAGLRYASAAIPTPPPSTATTVTPNSPSGNSSCILPSGNNGSQQQQQQQQKNPKLYKTELCRSWMDHGRCNYGERCQYAHGEREKRPVPRHPKYKTEACQSYHKTGYCPYGPRCHFIHNESPQQLKALIEQNEKALQMVQELTSIPITVGSETPKKSLMVSSSSTSLGACTHPTCGEGATLQKNHSMHAFPNGFHNNPFLAGKTQSFSNSPQQQHQEHFAPFFPFKREQQSQQQTTIGLNLLGSSYQHESTGHLPNNSWCAHQCSPENQHPPSFEPFNRIHSHHQRPAELFPPATSFPLSQQNQNRQQEGGGGVIPPYLAFSHPQSPLAATPFLGGNTPNSPSGSGELDPIQQLLGNLCSSDEEYSRSSLISSTADSGTESPLATMFDNDTLTKPNKESKKFAKQINGQIIVVNNEDDSGQQRRSSDGDSATEKANAAINNNSISTASSSLASLLSSSSSSQHNKSSLIVANGAASGNNASGDRDRLPQGKIRLPVFERLSLNQ